jgi:hypothetical protein
MLSPVESFGSGSAGAVLESIAACSAICAARPPGGVDTSRDWSCLQPMEENTTIMMTMLQDFFFITNGSPTKDFASFIL